MGYILVGYILVGYILVGYILVGYILVGYILVGYNILVGNIFTRFESYFVKILTHKNLMTMITTYKTSCPQRTLCML